jgi:hypothetical protein
MVNGRWVAALVAAVVAVCAGATTRAQDKTDMSAWYDPGPSYFSFRVYCNDAVVGDAGTKDTLTASFWNGDTLLSVVPHRGVDCNVWWNPGVANADFEPWYFDDEQDGATAHRFTHVILETDGSDAFFVDWASLTQDPTGRKIGQWGAPRGRGFCLSRDPNDIAGEWAAHSDTCDAALRFDVATGSVYGAQPVDLSDYEFFIDCKHSGLDRSASTSRMTFEVYDAQDRLLGRTTGYGRGPDCPYDDGTSYSMFAFQGPQALPTGSPAYVRIRTEGGEIQYIHHYIDQMWVTRNGVEVARVGRNEGMGWCLSVLPAHWTGAWQLYSVGGCFSGFQFDLRTSEGFPLQ